MTGHQMVIEDDKGNFEVLAMITNARYENGVFTVTFNKVIAPYIINIKGNYTSYSLANVLRFKCDYSFRIYELIKSEAWHLKKGDMNDYYVKEYKMEPAGIKSSRLLMKNLLMNGEISEEEY